MNRNRDMADTIARLFWDNFIKSEPALTMRDVITIELDKAEARAHDRIIRSMAVRLAPLYLADRTGIAKLCDKTLDPSGALLRMVRDEAMP